MSFGVVPVLHGRVLLGGAVHQLVRPATPPSRRSQTVHLLRPADLQEAPPIEVAREQLRDLLARRYLLVWFADVEVHFLARTFGGSLRAWRRRTIDVRNLAIAAAGEPADVRHRQGFALHTAARRYGVPVTSPHDALDDALVTAQLLLVLVSKLPGIAAPTRPRPGGDRPMRAATVSRLEPRFSRGVQRRPMARETAFHPITSRTAAGFTDEAGWLWVTNFGDVDAEYRAIREGVGMWDLSPLNKWEFSGPDAFEAAQRIHTNDILGMTPGQVRYGAFVDEEGLVVDDGTVFRFEDHLWVCTNSNEREEYFEVATKGLDVRISYIAPDLPEHADPGPEESRPAALDHRRGAGCAAVLPVPPRSRPGRRGAGLAVANGVQRRARVRGLPAARACPRALGGGARRGRDAVRRGRDRADPRRGRHDRDGLRLRAAPAHAVRPRPGSLRRAARAEHGHGGARDDRGRSTEPVPNRAPRGRTAAGLRRDRRTGGPGGRRPDVAGAQSAVRTDRPGDPRSATPPSPAPRWRSPTTRA